MRSISKYCLHQNFILICLILYMPGTCWVRVFIKGRCSQKLLHNCRWLSSRRQGNNRSRYMCSPWADKLHLHRRQYVILYTLCYIYISECLYCYNRSTVGWKSKDFRAGLSLQCFKILTMPLLHSHEFICKLCVQSNSSVYCWMCYHGLGPYFSSGAGDFVKIATESFFVCLFFVYLHSTKI